MNSKDITGKRYSRLVAISPHQGPGRSKWWWQCDCGNTKLISRSAVVTGNTRSCGCLKGEAIRRRPAKHGHRVGGKNSPTLQSYQNAKYRCTNPNAHNWSDYGGRGISMHPRWLESFENFLADMGEAPDGHTIERIDVDGHYEPGNCRWASKAEQAKNKRTTIWVEYEGQRMCLRDYAKAINRSYIYIHHRIRHHGADPAQLLEKNPERVKRAFAQRAALLVVMAVSEMWEGYLWVSRYPARAVPSAPHMVM